MKSQSPETSRLDALKSQTLWYPSQSNNMSAHGHWERGFWGGTSRREIVARIKVPGEMDWPGRPCAEERTAAAVSEREVVRYAPRTSA